MTTRGAFVAFAAVLALAGCDRVFGIGDPYEDARSGHDAGSDADVIPIDVMAGSDVFGMPMPTPIVYFPFDNDVVNHVNNQSATCTVPCVFESPGHRNAAIVLGGQGCVTFGITQMPPHFTIAMWTNASDTAGGPLFDRWLDSATQFDDWRIDGAPNAYTFTSYNGTGESSLVSMMGMPMGSWHHVAVTYDGMTRQFYVDGQPDRGDMMTVSTSTNATAFIGCNVLETSKISAMVDEVYVYDVALTPQQITTLYGM